MILPAVDPDPDPTTQIPWPGARKRSDRDLDDSLVSPPPANHTDDSSQRPSVGSRADANGKRRLSTIDLVNLSISMARCADSLDRRAGVVNSSLALILGVHLTFGYAQIWNAFPALPWRLRTSHQSCVAGWSDLWLDCSTGHW